VVLVSVPFPLYNRPSIQLGTLKSYLNAQLPDVKVDAHHIYLKIASDIGYRQYQAISERTWLAEAVYSALLYPDRFGSIEKFYQRLATGNPWLQKKTFKLLTDQIESITTRFIHSINWGVYGLAGFSISLCQLTAALYFIKQIKKRFPDLTMVAGGSMFAGESIRNVFSMFPEIDIIINGEGERPLSRLVRHLKNGGPPAKISLIPGVVTPESAASGAPLLFNQMEDLSALKQPDYDDYFNLLQSLGPQNAFFPTLPTEMSRGCWWRKSCENAKFSGCAFCNLNLQWNGYRFRNPSEIVSEIDALTTKHRTLSVAFMDNLLPPGASADIFMQLGNLGKDLRLFGEIRANTPRRVLTAMRSAGMHELQIGIEALSTRLLTKLNKGTTAIENLEIMKNCEALDISSVSNLILYFPGSDPEDLAETLRCLEFVTPFRPLKSVRFWLGYGSPVWQNPKAFGLKAVYNHPNYAVLFPQEVYRNLRFTVQAFRADLGYQKKLWRPVIKKLKEWKKVYAELHKGPSHEPILSYRDGREFLIIRQRRLGADPFTHRLEGTSRAIYLFCDRHRPLKSIVQRFQGFSPEKIVSFLRMMVEKKLMFEESEKYLSLAIPVRPANQ
jgi:ribosomal peptide maturation radical SAM protein 1